MWSYVLKATHPAGSTAQTFQCEYLDLVIPLNASSLVPGLVLQDQYEGRAHAGLADARLTGWHAQDPTTGPPSGTRVDSRDASGGQRSRAPKASAAPLERLTAATDNHSVGRRRLDAGSGAFMLTGGTRFGGKRPGPVRRLRCTKCGYVDYRMRWHELNGKCPCSACDGTVADTRAATRTEFQSRRGLQGWD